MTAESAAQASASRVSGGWLTITRNPSAKCAPALQAECEQCTRKGYSMSRTRGRFGTIALVVAIAASPRESEAQALRLRADALAEARSPAGLVMLQGQDRDYPWFDAEA